MRVLFFAQLKDVTRCEEIAWSEAGLMTGAQIWERLAQQWPALDPFRSTTRLARNCEFVPVDALFNRDDEVALIPPVSGG